jgi:hypothetical protein
MSIDTKSTVNELNVPTLSESDVLKNEPAAPGPGHQLQAADSVKAGFRRSFSAALERVETKLAAICHRSPVRPLVLAWALLALGLCLLLGGIVVHFRAAKPSSGAQVLVSTQAASAPIAAASLEKPAIVAPHSEVIGTESKTVLPTPGHSGATEIPHEAPPKKQEEVKDPKATQGPDAISGAKSESQNSVMPASSSTEAPIESSKAEDSLESVFGADRSGNGVPDRLDRWIHKTFLAKSTQEAALAYFRTALPLANKAFQGVSLSSNEKLMALRAAECYLVTAHEGGLALAPNLNDRVLMLGGEAAVRIKVLFKQLEGVHYTVAGNSAGACVGNQ